MQTCPECSAEAYRGGAQREVAAKLMCSVGSRVVETATM
jgi:hypothetical protein